MIARNDDSRSLHGPDHDDLAAQADALLERLASAVRRRDVDALMDCFGRHPVLMLAEIGMPVEGRGALRRHFQRSLPTALFAGTPALEQVDRRDGERALVRATVCDATAAPVKLVVAVGREARGWVITHCHWTAEARVAAA